MSSPGHESKKAYYWQGRSSSILYLFQQKPDEYVNMSNFIYFPINGIKFKSKIHRINTMNETNGL